MSVPGPRGSRMTTLGLLAVILLVGGIALGLGLWVGTYFNQPQSLPPPPGITVTAPGELAPELVFADLGNAEVALSAFRGRPLIINFWATWCAPCIEEMPMLSAFHSSQGQSGPQVLGIAQDQPQRVRAFLETSPVSYPIVFDRPSPGDASVRLGNTRNALPYTVLLDADGRILATHLGDFDRRELERWLRRHAVDFQ